MAHGFHEIEGKKVQSGEFWLKFTLEGFPSLYWINKIICRIIHLLKDADGYLDGWGYPVVKDEA